MHIRMPPCMYTVKPGFWISTTSEQTVRVRQVCSKNTNQEKPQLKPYVFAPDARVEFSVVGKSIPLATERTVQPRCNPRQEKTQF